MGKLYQSDLEMSLGNNVIVTQMTQAVNWARKYSFFIYPFITACCGMEFMSVAGPRYDLDRFGAAFPRFSPRQADLLMVQRLRYLMIIRGENSLISTTIVSSNKLGKRPISRSDSAYSNRRSESSWNSSPSSLSTTMCLRTW